MAYLFNKKSLAITILLVLVCQGFAGPSTCKSGQTLFSIGLCGSPDYIEGCSVYKSMTQCEVCGHNYVKKSGLCAFQFSGSNCCLQFDLKGECQRCDTGLFLNPNTKVCQDFKSAGCLQRNSQGCINCAKNFQLIYGVCIPSLVGCLQYKKNGKSYICTKCDAKYDLIRGECGDSSWQNYENCDLPFKKVNEKCIVPNCAHTFEWGCYECNAGYDLTYRKDCVAKKISGCIDYQSENVCRMCEDSLYQISNGICIPFGCLQFGNSVCTSCNTKAGFALSKGVCSIPYCIIAGKNGCQICQKGRVWFKQQCIPESNNEETVCQVCPSNYFINSQNECVKSEPGCLTYAQGACTRCADAYVLDQINKKCLLRLLGCIYNDKGACSSCSTNYFFSPKIQKCTIIGCKKYDGNGKCTQCSNIFKVDSNGFCSIVNCLQINADGCSRCSDGYQVNKNATCSAYDPNCAARNINEKCIGCKDSYYLDSNSFCKTSTLGCNYIDGKCTSCKTPFVYDIKTSSCKIDGCQQYFFGGCQICQKGYDLRYNTCKLPNCLTSNNGTCLQCDPDYLMRVSSNTCFNKDELCYQYNKQGECTQCAPKYFLSKLQNKCLERQLGCSYDQGDKCSTCLSPFKASADGKSCYLSGCLNYDLQGCVRCKYPFNLTSKKLCAIDNCAVSNDQKCIQCAKPYVYLNGRCQRGDEKCLQYDYQTSLCLNCIYGYKVQNGKCLYQDSHCVSFTKNGRCQNCESMFFINTLYQCELKDSNCQSYVNGKCTKCKPYYFYFNQICYPNSQGCLSQVGINQCTVCQEGYKLTSGNCLKKIVQLDWNSIDMGWDNQKDSIFGQKVFTQEKNDKSSLSPCFKSNYGKPFYSSDKNGVKDVSLQSQGYGWEPKGEKNQYVGVDLPKRQTFYAMDIKCLANNKLSKFQIQYSQDNGQSYRLNGQYTISCQPNQIRTIYFTAVQATTIRLVTLAGYANIRIQFYYNNNQYPTNMASQETIIQKNIRQSIQAATQLLSKTCDNQMCYFGLDICQPKSVLAFAINYDAGSEGSVSQAYVQYSVDGIYFECYNDCKPFNLGNGAVTFSKPIFAQKLRVHITGYQGDPKINVSFNYM